MADHIPFITGSEGGSLVKAVYGDSDVVRIPLHKAEELRRYLPPSAKLWLDPGVDGMHDLGTRRTEWLDFMNAFPCFGKIGNPAYHAKPAPVDVYAFVRAVMDRCATHNPAWITVPQLPLVSDSARNRMNRELAAASGKWKLSKGFSGKLIMPLVFTNQKQINKKTDRNPKVQQAEWCYHAARADGLWTVDSTLTDEDGSSTLRKRFIGLIQLHGELNDHIPSQTRIAGPYWALNLVLWSRGLVDYPAIGIGSGYQLLLAGGHTQTSIPRAALPSLRRRVSVRPEFAAWLSEAAKRLAPSHPALTELNEIRKQYTALRDWARARAQVATFYKRWFTIIAAAPKAGRSMALFQDLSAAYALGKSLPPFADSGPARRPEAVAEPLMLSCL